VRLEGGNCVFVFLTKVLVICSCVYRIKAWFAVVFFVHFILVKEERLKTSSK